MNIDIFSLIIGMVLWELISAYIYFIVRPALKRFKAEREQKDLEAKSERKLSGGYKATTIGFLKDL